MSTAQTKKIVCSIYDELWNERKLGVAKAARRGRREVQVRVARRGSALCTREE